MRRTVRFGIMCSGTTFPKWQAEAILNLLKLEGVTPELLILEEPKPKSFIKKFQRTKFKHFIWSAFLFLNRNKFKAMAKVDLSEALAELPGIQCRVTKKGKFSQYFSGTDVEKIKASNLDFILRFAFGIIRGEVLNAAKFGVWSFHHDDEEKYRGGPPCFWEIYHGDNVTGSVLQKLTDKLDSGIILKKGLLKTKYSYIQNKDQLLLESSRWPAMLCTDILNNHWGVFKQEASATSAPIYYLPNNWQAFLFLLKAPCRRILRKLKGQLFVDLWNIGVAKGPISSFLSKEKPEVDWYPLKAVDHNFVADPFVILDKKNSSELHVFFENYCLKKQKGVIDYTLYKDGFNSDPVTIIEDHTHYSYPYVIEENETYYLVPENFESNNIALHVAVEFPRKWSKDRIVIVDDFAGVDSTIVRWEGLYWLFCSDREDGVSHNLNLFYSESLTGGWVAHPKNPVKTDVRSARCAGTPFVHEEFLYRPSMDYSEKVEGRIIINKVTKISKTEFEETSVKVIDPYWDSYFCDKIHALCDAGNQTLVDGAKEIFIFTNWGCFKHRIAYIAKKLLALTKK